MYSTCYTERRKSKRVGMGWGGEMDPNRTTTKKIGLPLIYSLYEDTTLCGCWLRVDGIPVYSIQGTENTTGFPISCYIYQFIDYIYIYVHIYEVVHCWEIYKKRLTI